VTGVESSELPCRAETAQRLQDRNRLSGCRLAVDPGRDTLRLFEVAHVDRQFLHRLAPGVLAAFQRLIPTGEQSGLQTHIATTEKRFVVRADEKLTAFMQLESAIRSCGTQRTA